MKLSIHNTVGKATKEQLKLLGDNWMNDECSWEDAFDYITVAGLATSAELWTDNRIRGNFVSRQLVMLDIDDGMTLEDLKNDEFYSKYGAGFYVTPSHTDENHRFRIIFRLESKETDKDRYEKIVQGLMFVYKYADPACKDAIRLYYGTPNCEIKEKTNKLLTNDVVESLIEYVDIEEAQEIKQLQKQPTNNYVQHQYDTIYVDELLNRLQRLYGTLKHEYHTWRDIAWATCGTLGIGDAQALMMKHWPTKTKQEMQTLKSFKASQAKHKVGTLIKLSKISKEDLYKLELEFKQRNNLLTENDLLKQFMGNK
tara:strand:- start:1594 stop:2529 length:936 start_codon:yes stop_codon:yes gene_type:complete